MEQKLEMNGLNLNPMFYWKYVMKNKTQKSLPLIVLSNIPQTVAETLALNLHQADYIAFDAIPNGYFPIYNNVKFTNRSKYTDIQYWELLSKTDFFLSEKQEENYEAGLCGCKVLESWKGLFTIHKQGKLVPLTSIDRINNWEKTKSLLTN